MRTLGSKPGQALKRRTGIGQKNIRFEFNRRGMFGRVGYSRNTPYMAMHELGINYPHGRQTRPTLKVALKKHLHGKLFATFKAAVLAKARQTGVNR